jgi:BRCA1 C Terminus (BRCT) domain
VLSKKRTLLITNNPPSGEKFKFAVQNNIPIVSDNWLHACVKEKRVVPFTKYLVEGQNRGGVETPEGKKRMRTDGQDQAIENKRPRPLEETLRGGKVLGEKLPLLGDRFKKKVAETTAADMAANVKTFAVVQVPSEASKQGEQMNVSAQNESTRVDKKENGILDNCVVCVSRGLQVFF